MRNIGQEASGSLILGATYTRQGDKETSGHGDRGTKGQGDKGTRRALHFFGTHERARLAREKDTYRACACAHCVTAKKRCDQYASNVTLPQHAIPECATLCCDTAGVGVGVRK